MNFYTASLTTLIFQSKMFQSLIYAQNAPLFFTKVNVQSVYLIL